MGSTIAASMVRHNPTYDGSSGRPLRVPPRSSDRRRAWHREPRTALGGFYAPRRLVRTSRARGANPKQPGASLRRA